MIQKAIDFKAILKETGVKKGKLYRSKTFNSWVVQGHSTTDLICIDPPHEIGDTVEGKKITNITIKNNCWIFHQND